MTRSRSVWWKWREAGRGGAAWACARVEKEGGRSEGRGGGNRGSEEMGSLYLSLSSGLGQGEGMAVAAASTSSGRTGMMAGGHGAQTKTWMLQPPEERPGSGWDARGARQDRQTDRLTLEQSNSGGRILGPQRRRSPVGKGAKGAKGGQGGRGDDSAVSTRHRPIQAPAC